MAIKEWNEINYNTYITRASVYWKHVNTINDIVDRNLILPLLKKITHSMFNSKYCPVKYRCNTLLSVHYVLHTTFCTLRSAHCVPHTTFRTLRSAHCVLSSMLMSSGTSMQEFIFLCLEWLHFIYRMHNHRLVEQL